MSRVIPWLPAALALALAGCATLPRDRGHAETAQLVETRSGASPAWSMRPGEPDVAELASAQDAVRLALARSPRVREAHAQLLLGRAELEDARRPSNPRFGIGRLEDASGATEVSRRLSWGLTDLLLLPSRTRLAQAELDRVQHAVADELLTLAADAEAAWHAAVGAQQVAAMRDLVAQAAQRSAELAGRFHDAGNISRLQLEQERAAASRAGIDAARAAADALRARAALAALIGQPVAGTWRTASRLPLPLDELPEVQELIRRAQAERLDLDAARQAVANHEAALGSTRRWRWLGSVELEYEREREPDGSLRRGPGVALELPLFNQGQGAVARAEAGLERARARLDALQQAVADEVRVQHDAVSVAREIAARFRRELVPSREAILARTQERYDFMLVGVFDLLRARQEEYDAYQSYLEAVRDYWIARAALRRMVGGRLPDDGLDPDSGIGAEDRLPSPGGPSHDRHGSHEGHGHGAGDAADPDRAADDVREQPHHHGSGATGAGNESGSHDHTQRQRDRHRDHEHHDHTDSRDTREGDGGHPRPREDEMHDPHAEHDHGDRP